jgi:hypothetical protein
MAEGDKQDNSNNPTDNPSNPSQQGDEGKSPLEEAKEVLEETKKTLALISEERKRIEKVAADSLVNGKTFAGQKEKVETADEKWAREAKERYKETGMDPT